MPHQAFDALQQRWREIRAAISVDPDSMVYRKPSRPYAYSSLIALYSKSSWQMGRPALFWLGFIVRIPLLPNAK
jgi:hypothetical protein